LCSVPTRGKYPLPLGGGGVSHVIWGENMKRGIEKGGIFERKRKKGERKEKIGM
jgi:hypothetical protein